MSWLKRVGAIALAVGKAAPVAGPIIAAVVPGDKDNAIIAKAIPTIDQIAQIIVQAEIMGQSLSLSGTDKLLAASPAVAHMVIQSSLFAGKTIDDPVKFQFGCQQIAAGMADCLNSLKADS